MCMDGLGLWASVRDLVSIGARRPAFIRVLSRGAGAIYPGARAAPLFECVFGGGAARRGTGLEQLKMRSGKLLAFLASIVVISLLSSCCICY